MLPVASKSAWKANAFTFLCILMVQTTHTSWWYLGLSSSAYHSTMNNPRIPLRNKCSEIDVLGPTQRDLCSRSPNVLDSVRDGAGMGIDECQHQFSRRRWNCTTYNSTDVFGRVLQLKTREKAYIYAISAAGVMHAITKACAKGQLSMCDCDTKIRSRDTQGNFMWGGCSHNIKFGNRFAREFVDSNEDGLEAEGLMNLWNNNAGRKAIENNMKILCKCHGVSGSCSAKICWRTMSQFRTVGSYLKDKFDGASQMRPNSRNNRLRPTNPKQKKPSKRDLVYLEESPDFCDPRADIGSLGTRGRECNKTSYGLDGCSLMCCGRGYHTIPVTEVEDCDCKFVWCCHVECQQCVRRLDKHFCN